MSRSPNFVGFSVSDIHIIAVLERLGLGIQHWPDYGSAYEIRIHDDCSVVLDELNNSRECLPIVRKDLLMYRTERYRRIDQIGNGP